VDQGEAFDLKASRKTFRRGGTLRISIMDAVGDGRVVDIEVIADDWGNATGSGSAAPDDGNGA